MGLKTKLSLLGDREIKSAPFSLDALGPNLPLMRFDDMFRNG